MVSCKQGEAGSFWRQQTVLGLLSTSTFPGEPVLLRASAPCASKARPSLGAVCPKKKTFLGRRKKKNALLSRPLSSALYGILSFLPLPPTFAARVPTLVLVLESHCWQENSFFSTTVENL